MFNFNSIDNIFCRSIE